VHRDAAALSLMTSTSPVQAGADREAELRHFLRQVWAQRTARAGLSKVAKVAVARGIDFPAAEAPELAPREAVELLQPRSGAVADRRRALRRVDDIGEHHGREHAVDVGRMPRR
jgi:hypothetical protein